MILSRVPGDQLVRRTSQDRNYVRWRGGVVSVKKTAHFSSGGLVGKAASKAAAVGAV
jgi:hypothetical protein